MNQVNQLQSKTISYIRFPLIVLIVYIHNQGMGTPLREVSISWANFTDIDAYNLLRLVITEVIARAAVPAFFILSGYLFFFGKTSFSREIWLTALKKRFWTLFVEYYCSLFHNCLLSHKRLAKRFKFYAYFLK